MPDGTLTGHLLPPFLISHWKYVCHAPDCGLCCCHVMADASWIAGTSTYDQLVANCTLARQAEVNWAVQFEKVRVAIDDILARRAPARAPAPAPASASARPSRRRAAAAK